MHRLNVAHRCERRTRFLSTLTWYGRDCSELNIMMDAESMYPKGFHPVSQVTDATAARAAYPKRRRDAKVRYYFIDFGISTKFEPDEPKSVLGAMCQDFEVPELSETTPYNPFFTDVFILGNVFRRAFIHV